MEQLTLTSGREGPSIQERFLSFHQANPHVYAELVRLARLWRDRIGTTPGVGMLWEVMRWNLSMQTLSRDVYKLNDHYRSRYARLIMEQEPDLAEAFETRRLRAA